MSAHHSKPEIAVTPSTGRITTDVAQARLLIEALEHAIKTSNALVHALLDGSANDKKIGKYIVKTTKQTDALLDQQACKQLALLMEKILADFDTPHK